MGTTKISQALRSTAYHEAGHATCNYWFGMKMKAIWIEQEEGEVIRTPLLAEDDEVEFWKAKKEGKSYPKNHREWLDHQAVSNLAGPIAEEEFNPRYDYLASESDYEAVENLGILWEVGDALKWEEEVKNKAKQFVQEHWDEITAVAEALLEHQTLTGDQVEQIIEATVSAKLAGKSRTKA